MTLTATVVAWVLVSALFLGWAWLARGRQLSAGAVLAILGEAGALTLLAGLWFSSLGRGGWSIVFLLLGVMVSGAERGTRAAFLRSPFLQEVLGFSLGVARYVAAGALLAWRLG